MTRFETSRLLAASPSRVFAAMVDPLRLARWWGPDGFSNHFFACDVHPGGRWEFDMVGPDAKRYANVCVFLAVDLDERLVIEHVCAPLFTLTITLTAQDAGTHVSWVQVFEDEAVAAAVRDVVMVANEQNLERLAAVVASS